MANVNFAAADEGDIPKICHLKLNLELFNEWFIETYLTPTQDSGTQFLYLFIYLFAQKKFA